MDKDEEPRILVMRSGLPKGNNLSSMPTEQLKDLLYDIEAALLTELDLFEETELKATAEAIKVILEHDSVDTPGAQHVAAASGIIFLFDPFNHHDFKRAIRKQKSDDPQFNQPTEDWVTVILSELKKRIEQINNTDKLKAPLAFAVGKYDSWHQLVPEGEEFWEPREEGVLRKDTIKHNSDLTRTVLRKISPGLVAQAEALSENTMFFPVSNFGVPPVTHKNERGETFIVPDPQKLNPMFADIPVLWLNSQFNPERESGLPPVIGS